MAQYVTLKAIGKRMGWKQSDTVIRKMKKDGFLMYQDLRGHPPQKMWVTDDALIQTWEIARCKASREHIIRSGKYKYLDKVRKNKGIMDGALRAIGGLAVGREEGGAT